MPLPDAAVKHVLLLERGDDLKGSRANWDSKAVLVDEACQATQT